jgi:hypothetical protein
VLDSLSVEAFIPFKVNAVVNPKAPTWSRHLCEFTLNQERFLAHYHRRSNVETVFAMMKARFGAAVASRVRLPLDGHRLGHAAVRSHVTAPGDPEHDRVLVLAGAATLLEVWTRAGRALDVDEVAL